MPARCNCSDNSWLPRGRGIAGRHADIHECVHFGISQLAGVPDVFEKAPDDLPQLLKLVLRNPFVYIRLEY